jgi:hypothetical protein
VWLGRREIEISTDKAPMLQPIMAIQASPRRREVRARELRGVHQREPMVPLAVRIRHGNMPAREGVASG